MNWRGSLSVARPIVDFWSELQGTIHPRDEEVLVRHPNSFKTEYPPPAFIGDVYRARIFILWANGGYHPVRTSMEFSKPGSADSFRDRLRRPRPWATPKFQEQAYLRKWLEAGDAAIVNAMGYRSAKLAEKQRRIADKLTSVQFHRKWLHSHLIPACGKVMIIVHRPGLWKLREDDLVANDYLVFTRNSASRYLPTWVIDRGERFLAETRQVSGPL